MNAQALKIVSAPRPEDKYTPHLLPQEGPAWLKDLRANSLALFHERGFPGAKLERWKYTNLAPRVKDFPASLSAFDINESKPLMESLEQAWVRKMLETPAPGDDRHKDMGLWHLNNAYLRDGLIIDITAENSGKSLNLSRILNQHGFISPRLIVRIADNVHFSIFEKHDGFGTVWNNEVTQIKVGKNAVLRHYRVQDYGRDAIYTQNTHVEIEEGGIYESFALMKGGKISRNQVHAEIKGLNAACNLYALNLLDGEQHGDSTWLIEHQAPNCTSDQSVRSLLGGKAHGVFQGKIHVHREGQKTDGYQLSNALLLSDGAQMNTKPELEIYADDVKCSHGATTGQLDEEALFYMRSRGLSEAEARFLVVNAFVAELVDKLGDKTYAAEIQAMAEEWLRSAL